MLEADGVELRWSEYRGGGRGGVLSGWRERARFLSELGSRPPEGAVILVQKVLPPPGIVRRWRAAGHRVLYDFDDALHEHFSWGESRRKARRRKVRFDRMLDLADHVIAGSPPLADYVRDRGQTVDVMYPSLLRERFPAPGPVPDAPERPLALGWIGNRQSQHYLTQLVPVLEELFGHSDRVRLCVCSSDPPALPADLLARMDFVPWSEEGELEALQRFDIGVSPLGPEPWSRARGGRVSVLLALASGVPVCAAPGGGLEELVGSTGAVRFADEPRVWLEALTALTASADLRRRQGRAARELIESKIWADVQYPRLRSILFP